MAAREDTAEEFSRLLLKPILGREPGKLRVYVQKHLPGDYPQRHGARLDFLVQEYPEDGFETELPTDIYDYELITSFDPFGLNRMVYTVKNRCMEAPDMEYDDGAENLFLYCEGEGEGGSEELRDLLRYMVSSRKENAINAELQRLHTIVEDVKNGTEVTKTAMWNEYVQKMHDDDLIRVTREAAIEEGRTEVLLSLVKDGLLTASQAAARLGESEAVFQKRLQS